MPDYNESDDEISSELARRKKVRRDIAVTLSKTDLPESEQSKSDSPGYVSSLRARIKKLLGGSAGATASAQGKALRSK